MTRFSGWYEGERYDARLGDIYYYDEAQEHSRIEPVEILDKRTGIVHRRIGDGRQIGNFHPIFINWKGKRILLERLLRPHPEFWVGRRGIFGHV